MTKLRIEEPDRLDTDPTAAQAAVQTFEAVPDGAAFASQADAATEAVGALAAGARTALFPTHVAMTADVTTTFLFYEELFPRSRYATHAAALHAECLVVQPDLAAFLRSGPVCARVAAAAVASAPAVSGSMGATAALAIAEYQQTIAAQLVGIPEYEPHATILALQVPALQARIDACRMKHQAHVAGELQRISAETRQAAETIAAAEQQQREELAMFFSQQHGRPFVVKGNVVSGQGLAALLKHQGAYGFDGMIVSGITLADMLEARAREEAADAAVAAGGLS